MKTKMVVVWLSVALLILAGCPQTDSAQEEDNPKANTPPVLSSVVPASIPAGSGNTNVTMTGSGFKNPIVAQWNNAALLPTTLLTPTKMVATIPALALQFPGTGTIRALQGGQGNQVASGSLTITITSSSPTLTSVTPLHALVGAPPVTLTMVGTNFNSTSVAKWTAAGVATALATTFVSATQLTAVVPTSLLVATSATATVLVANGTANSSSQTFVIVTPLSITTTTLPSGSTGVAYTATLAAAGGTTPYSWSITGGTLPAGLALAASTGVISGTPTTAGSSSITVTVTDSTGGLARKVLRGKKQKEE